MLYDQAQLAVAYTNAYLITKQDAFADVVNDILTYVSRDLSHPVWAEFFFSGFLLRGGIKIDL